ncbi:MAG: DNA polymerase III subunit [Elusimicrobia bacterium]|nr:DNA polymerase III subunit [Elusimicrobiota bacterium]MBP9127628.1 DNA polymerase III subunit [Elusimicrobiota bacterium]MBP9698662.1 DNA polymerase III subunit [Elusimicrobiota bacterium]
MANEIAERFFPEVLGQDNAVQTLTAALTAGRAPHAYLFTGPAGVGKKTTARAWAKALLCVSPTSVGIPCAACSACKKVNAHSHPDLLWVDFEFQAALLKEPLDKQKSLKIATVREMERLLRLKPLEGRVKVAVLTPADLVGDDASHALLKILEEPPPGTHIVLISDEAGALLATIRSRCQRVRFRPLALEVVSDIVAREHGNRPAAEVDRAARAADGSVERARALLEENTVLAFDWATCPLSELLTWCEGFQNPRVGRTGAERFLEALLAQFQLDVRAGDRSADDLDRALLALTRIRQNANVGLTLQHLLLHIRRNARKHGG